MEWTHRPVVRTTLGILWAAASIAVGAFLQIPIGPVPISLQTLFVLLAGFLLGPWKGAAAVGLYLVVGWMGLPVFAGGTAGAAKLFGATGGFLVGFLPAVVLAGSARADSRLEWKQGLLWGGLASLVIFVTGVPWLKYGLDLTWARALQAGMWPFLPGAVIKLILAILIARALPAGRLSSE